ncbi:MAG: caspase family protein [Anaerolineae bacterium]|uniref:caspase family protein n=1 Tax=Candidatus Amarolinea dominans TaxID=3140696 RepID=UPI00313668AC|nr:caspase family protein [Anaerolineae bacterium]
MVKTQENNVLLAACRDNQTSADAYIANDYHGAFTWYLAEALQATGGHLTYRQLAERIGNGGQGYAQQPQLECQPASFDRQVFAPAA